MQLLQKLGENKNIKKLCLASSLLGLAVLSSPNKALAKNKHFANFQKTSFSSNNLGSNLIAEEVKPAPINIAEFATLAPASAPSLAKVTIKPEWKEYIDKYPNMPKTGWKVTAKKSDKPTIKVASAKNFAAILQEEQAKIEITQPIITEALNIQPPVEPIPAENIEVAAVDIVEKNPQPIEFTQPKQPAKSIIAEEDLIENNFDGAKPEQVLTAELPTPSEGTNYSPDFDTIREDAQILENGEQEFTENYLLLKVTSGKILLNQGVSAYDVGGQLYISLYELTETVEFPIEVFDEEQRAEGWFIETDNDFYLSVLDKELIIKGRNQDFNEKDVKIIDEEIYVSSNALYDWFGLNFDLNFSRLTLDIESTEKLAFEQKIERDKKRKTAGRGKKRERKTYPKYDLPYKFIEVPTATVLLNGSYSDSNGATTSTGGYSIQGTGDLLGMTGEYFIAGTDEELLNDARLRLYRYDNDSVIKGTDIKQLEIGDISPARLNLAGGGGTERGVKITNKALGTVTTPDNVLIEGEVEPGWEVELYRNGEFLGFVTDTNTGRYEFSGLSLQGGLNLFRIIKYGPFGEKEEEFQRYFIGAGMLKQGEVNYEFSATQVGAALLPTTEDFELSADHRLVANVEYGITENFSLGGGVYSGPIAGQNRNALSLSSRASILGTYNRLDHLANDDGSSISSFSNRISFEDFNISAFATYNNGFDEVDIDSVLNARGDISTNFSVFGLTDLGVRFGTEYETFQTDKVRYAYNNQLSTTIQGFALSNTVKFETTETAGTESEIANGEFFFRKRFDDSIFNTSHDILLRTSVNYSLKPLQEVDSASLRVEKNINDSLRLRMNIAQTYGANEKTDYSLGTNYINDYFSTSVNASFDSDSNMSVGMNFRFNVGPDHENGGLDFIQNERAQKGTVAAFAFLDKNYNGKFDADEEPLEDITFKSRFGIKATTNANGTAYMNGFSGYKTDDITVEISSLPDIYYVPTVEGLTIVPRPGNTTNLEFPLVLSGEIDGLIEFSDEQINNSYDFSQFKMELVNTEGEIIKEISADQTGYYIFERVIPDDYKVRISAQSIENNEFIGQSEIQINMDIEEPIVTDLNFISASAKEEITDKELELL